uniref:F-box domain-containing protein n=1 Tax=Leersia perrieri TaxID=77586 RepID=A0A0D9X588_9ORYZ
MLYGMDRYHLTTSISRRLRNGAAVTFHDHVTVFNSIQWPPERDWSDLPTDLLCSVFRRLGHFELLTGGAAATCRSWRRAARGEPELWRRVDEREFGKYYWRVRRMAAKRVIVGDLHTLTRAAVKFSGGQCEAYRGEFVDDDLLPFLSEKEVLEVIASSCPQLKHFGHTEVRLRWYTYDNPEILDDRAAMAISRMTELRSLQLSCHNLTNEGLAMIIDNCPHLENLDIRLSSIIDIDATMRAKYYHMIKTKKLKMYMVNSEYDLELMPDKPVSMCSTCLRMPYDIDDEGFSDYNCDIVSDDDDDDDDDASYYLSQSDETNFEECDGRLNKSIHRAHRQKRKENKIKEREEENRRACLNLSPRRVQRHGLPAGEGLVGGSELPMDAILQILHKLDHVNILMGAGLACRSWRAAARDEPSLWRRINMRGFANLPWRLRRDSGVIGEFLRSAPCLRSLRLISCFWVTEQGVAAIIKKCPLLETLDTPGCERIDRHADTLRAKELISIRAVHGWRWICREDDKDFTGPPCRGTCCYWLCGGCCCSDSNDDDNGQLDEYDDLLSLLGYGRYFYGIHETEFDDDQDYRMIDKGDRRDWADGLLMDVITHILGKLDTVELLLGGTAAACRSWRRAARDEPSLWHRCYPFSAPSLKSLRLTLCHDISSEAFAAAISKFHLLEELEVSSCQRIEHNGLPELVAKSCPKIKHFRYTRARQSYSGYNISNPVNDRGALAIASMRELRSLHLFRDNLTNQGLMAILDNCPYLESLDLRICGNLTMDATLEARCSMIKTKSIHQCNPDDEDEDFQQGSPVNFCSPDMDSDSDLGDILGIEEYDDQYDCFYTVPLAVFHDMYFPEEPVPDAILQILHKLDHVDILMGAGLACRSWRAAARDEPSLWRRIDMRGFARLPWEMRRGRGAVGEMAREAVRRSAGQCEAFWSKKCGDDDVLTFLAEHQDEYGDLLDLLEYGDYFYGIHESEFDDDQDYRMIDKGDRSPTRGVPQHGFSAAAGNRLAGLPMRGHDHPSVPQAGPH